MKYLSVCSGIEAFSVAVQGLDFQPVGFCEIEPFPCAVLQTHFPDVPNFGDIRNVTKANYPTLEFDLLVGGTPCQSFSIAGGREGLRGVSGLAMDYVRIAKEFRPEWLLWENVPGVFTSNHGEDFRAFLSALDEIGFSLAWRVLDAQYFGLAQRRKRVFLVGHSRDVRRPFKVLFECEGSKRDPEKGREERKTSSPGTGTGSKESGYRLIKRGYYEKCDVAATLRSRDDITSADLIVTPKEGVANCLPDGICPAITAKWSKGNGGPAGHEWQNLVLL